MRVIKRETEFGTDVILRQNNNKYLTILFAGNLDLYWMITDKSKELDICGSDFLTFDITKENFALYETFRDLFIDISYKRISDSDEAKDSFFDSESYERYNLANYNELISHDRKTITWYSDETASEVGNYVVITDNSDSFHIEFHTQPHLEGYDREFKTSHSVSIRFRNSGSKYNPFNIVFMRMYHKLQDVEDTHIKGHQIHIEEYMYNVARKKCKVKKGSKYEISCSKS